MKPNVEDDTQTAAAVAAVVILLLVTVVGLVALVSHGSTRQNNSPGHHQLNAPVSVVPLALPGPGSRHNYRRLSEYSDRDVGAHMQQANHGPEDGRMHQPQLIHHLRPVDSVASLRDPPPAYPAHHLDEPFDAVANGHGIIGNPAAGPVHVVPLQPPPYAADHDGDHQHP
ncbi:hypothetical protein FRC04_006458 [Tulasnella sp. 424]|nr:hypothetical protein FRC04_006458 [Tulasnella sp. 424]